jgi:hypothetical protein
MVTSKKWHRNNSGASGRAVVGKLQAREALKSFPENRKGIMNVSEYTAKNLVITSWFKLRNNSSGVYKFNLQSPKAFATCKPCKAMGRQKLQLRSPNSSHPPV